MNDKIKEIIDSQTKYFNLRRQNRRLNNLIREYFGEDFYSKDWTILYELFKHEFPQLKCTSESFKMMYRRAKKKYLETINSKENLHIEKKIETEKEQIIKKSDEIIYPEDIKDSEDLSSTERLKRAIERGKLEGKSAIEVINSWDYDNQKRPEPNYFTTPYPKKNEDEII